MAFTRETVVVPVAIEDIVLSLFDGNPLGTEGQAARVAVQVRMSNGGFVTRHFDLADHVSAATINQLRTLAATIRAKAIDEILPTP